MIGNQIKFLPWVGPAYANSVPRLLILGESHYGDPSDDPETTRRLTDEYLRGKWNHRFWTQIGQVVSGRRYSETDRAEIWKPWAFYNYVQVIVADSARQAPSREMFENAEGAFWEVLDSLRPTHLLVLGISRLWPAMPPVDEEGLSFICAGNSQPFGTYSREWGRCIASPIVHPSAGFSAQRWYPIVNSFLELDSANLERAS
jgi:hypothetical protein